MISLTNIGNWPVKGAILLTDVIDWSLLLRAVQIVLTASIALIPPFYPKFSRYRRHAQTGLEKLEEVVFHFGSIRVGLIEEGETGFDELLDAIESHYPLSGDVQRIRVALGDPKAIETQLDMELGSMLGPNAVVFAEYKDGVDRDHDIITFHPFDPAQTLKLTELRRWIQSQTRDRSQLYIIITTLLWTVISISTIL